MLPDAYGVSDIVPWYSSPCLYIYDTILFISFVKFLSLEIVWQEFVRKFVFQSLQEKRGLICKNNIFMLCSLLFNVKELCDILKLVSPKPGSFVVTILIAVY